MSAIENYVKLLNSLNDKELLSLSVLLHTTMCRGVIFNRNCEIIKMYMTGAEMEALNKYFNKNMSLAEAGAGYKLNMANVSRKFKNVLTEHIL